MLNDDAIKEIAARIEAATPGPWTIAFNGSIRSGWAVMRANSSGAVFHLDPSKNIDLDEANHQVDADLDFVQFARTDMEVLLEEVEALRTIKKDDSAPAHQQDLQEAQLALQEIAQRCERLQQALEFYGALDNYRPPKPAPGETPPLWIGNDLGRRAREALGVPEISSIPETDDIN